MKEKYFQFIFKENLTDFRRDILELFKIIDSTVKIYECPFDEDGFFDKEKINELAKNRPSLFVTFYGRYGPYETKLVIYNNKEKYFFDSIIEFFHDEEGFNNIENDI